MDNCIPYHKFYKFIKEEISKLDRKINMKNNYSKSKYETVNFVFIFRL